MEWLNIHIAKQLRSPEAIGSAPAELGTWVRVLAFCCEQENGGRIVGGATWKDRQWQQLCAVTIRELKEADRLIRFEGEDIVVNGYPKAKEEEVQRARRRATAGAMARWGHRSGSAQGDAQASAQAHARADAEGEREGEREGEAAAAPPSASIAKPQPQPPPAPPTEIVSPSERQPACVNDPLAMDRMQAAPPAKPIPTDDWIAWKRSRRIFIARSDEHGSQDDWRDLFRTAGAVIMTQAYDALIPTVQPPRGVGFAAIRRWIFDRYQEPAA